MEINDSYQSLLQTKVGNDSYVSATVQTIDNGEMLQKDKCSQMGAIVHVESGAQWEPKAEQEVGGDLTESASASAYPELLRKGTAQVFPWLGTGLKPIIFDTIAQEMRLKLCGAT